MMRDASFHGRVAGLPAAASVPAQFWQGAMPPSFGAQTSPEPPLKVYLNYGRWIAECPDCNGAQLACHEDPRFMCNECANVAAGGLWRTIEWPADRSAIEEILSWRPRLNQNWTPGESVADLEAENAGRRY
jgi:hypothetical protein